MKKLAEDPRYVDVVTKYLVDQFLDSTPNVKIGEMVLVGMRDKAREEAREILFLVDGMISEELREKS